MASSSKKTKYMCNYLPDMKKTYYFVEPSKVSSHYFFCTICGKDI